MLTHPNVVFTHAVEQVDSTGMLVLEFVEGIDLSRLVREQGPLDLLKACDYARQAALALQYLSDKGLVHRDVKSSKTRALAP